MRPARITVPLVFFLLAPVSVNGQTTPANTTQAPVDGQGKLLRSQAEVRQLEQDVDRQESDSRQASERLEQQDQEIAELRKQLRALQSGTTDQPR